MKRTFEIIVIVILGILTYVFIASLPLFLQKDKIQLSDNELRQKALSLNIIPMPKTYNELLKFTNNPDNPLSKEKILLGKKLFNDTNLSKNRDISCASCHKLNEGGDDNLPTAIGDRNQENPKHLNTPTVLNSALSFKQFWDARAKDLEEQASGPIQAHFEMNMTKPEVVNRVRKDEKYQEEFLKVFNKQIVFEDVLKAIAAYERTLITRGKFDEFLEGDNQAISAKAKKGLNTFLLRGCKSCHSGYNIGGQSIQKFPVKMWWEDALNLDFSEFPDIKIKDNSFPFENIGGFKGISNTQKFKVPSLKNITKTAPYFHNGSVKDLKEVIKIMGKYQLGIEFTNEEIEELEEFLKTLEGELINYDIY